jgi:hypothetical protein
MSLFSAILKYCNELPKKIDNSINDIMQEEAILSEKQAKQTIIKYNRIDTGLMLKTVRAETLFEKNKKTYSLISDQEQRGIYYSSFQEFGTSRGIKGIYFVTNSFNNAVENLQQKIQDELYNINEELTRGIK